MPHRNWRIPPKHRVMDIKGMAVALAFLLAISLFAGGRGDKAGADRSPSDVSAQGESRQTAEALLGTDSIRPEQPTAEEDQSSSTRSAGRSR
jgi:hypothetical protein